MPNDELKVRIGADLTELKSGLQDASNAVEKFSGKVDESAGDTKKLDKANKEFNDTMGQTLGALDQTVQKLTGVNTGFGKNYRAVKQAATGLGSFKTALIATGLGVAIVLLGALVEHWDDLENALSATYSQLQKNRQELEGLGSALIFLEKEIDLINARIKLDEGLGNNSKELLKIKKELLQEELLLNQKMGDRLRKQIGILEARVGELTIVQKLHNLVNATLNLPPVNFINFEALESLRKAKLALLDNEIGLTKIITAISKMNGAWKDNKKVVADARSGTKDAFNAEIKRLKDEQSALVTNSKEWENYADKIQDVINKLYVLKNGGASTRETPGSVQSDGGVGIVPLDSSLYDDFTDGLLNVYPIMDEELSKMQDRMLAFNDSMNELIGGSITDTFGRLGDAIGEALAAGGNVFESIGQSLIASLGKFLSDMGGLLIKYGTLAVAKGKLDLAILAGGPIAIGAGIAAIAIGVALKAAGAAIGSAATGGSSSSSSSSDNYGSRTSTISTSSGGGTYVFEIAGTKLVGVLKNTLDRNRALGGSLSID